MEESLSVIVPFHTFAANMILTDTHTHLYAEQFDEDRDEMVKRALDAGVSRLFMPNIDSTSIEGMMQLAEKYPENCFPMMGLHPCSVIADYEKELAVVEEWHSKYKFCAVGEIGIDLYWDKTFFAEQQAAFKRQVELAKKLGLPIIIHTRDSFNETYEIVSELNDDSLKGIFHCFSGMVEEAEKVIALGGFKMGIGGVLTFKNSKQDEVVRQIDLKHLVLETDSPYLTPHPYRGKRNESAYTRLVAEKMAEVHGVSLEEVAKITTANSKEVYGI